ncbi:MAG: 3-hydroxyacyl-CoA dehydrogenase NAD-binding domain-containing protein, partial [Pseudomonadota bacterium]
MTDSTARVAAVIGGGVIGGGWAARFLLNGWDVNVFDPDPEADRKLAEVLANARQALPSVLDVPLPAEGTLTRVDSIAEAVSGAAWVQESVPERIEIKHTVFAEIAGHTSDACVVASSTSGYKPTDLQAGCPRPEQLIVAHPFNPVYLLPLVEVVAGEQTDPATVERAS